MHPPYKYLKFCYLNLQYPLFEKDKCLLRHILYHIYEFTLYQYFQNITKVQFEF